MPVNVALTTTMKLVLAKILLQILRQVPPEEWDTSTPRKSATATPVVIRLKDPNSFSRVSQYPLKEEGLVGLKPLISEFLQTRPLILCNSPCDTPIPAVKKSGSS